MRLLLVEDEERIAELVQIGLERSGFVVDRVGTAADARASAELTAFDAVILDLGLPDADGSEFLKELRARDTAIPVLILTARDAVSDRASGLDAGADDYLVKPFAIAELTARVKALLRRPGQALGLVLQAGNIAFDTVGRDVRVNDVPLSLARQELAVLEHLMRRLGRVVPRAVLEDKLYGIDAEPESNTIPVHVHHLRRKLEEAGASAQIHTVRGVGYLLVEADP